MGRMIETLPRKPPPTLLRIPATIPRPAVNGINIETTPSHHSTHLQALYTAVDIVAHTATLITRCIHAHQEWKELKVKIKELQEAKRLREEAQRLEVCGVVQIERLDMLSGAMGEDFDAMRGFPELYVMHYICFACKIC